MTPEQRWQAVQDLFDAALAHEAAEREAFVNAACAGDDALRGEVLSLLVAFEQSEGIEERGLAWLDAVSETMGTGPTLEGRRYGAFQVVRELGRGGMGAVYLADRADGQFEQRVALKLVRPGLASETLRQRFLYERQILARLQHPHIARLLDGGVTDDGQPYFAMEYIEGQPIDAYCDARRLRITPRLHLFKVVCDAVQYAHQNLVVHRDLKPSNILVTEAGQIKLLDFGIAKLLEPDEPSALTQTGFRAMTPEYAAPEQVRGEAVTTATDVYTLGVVLYELLTGHRPYQVHNRSPVDVERIICEAEPPRPSTMVTGVEAAGGSASQALTPEAVSHARSTQPALLQRRLVGDLDMIVMKALAKEPARRYASAEQLAKDLTRHLAGLPVEAQGDSVGYRVRKFVRRHRMGVVAGGLVALSLLAGVVGTSWQARRATRTARLAEAERDKAQQVSALLINLFQATDPYVVQADTLSLRTFLAQGARRIERELAEQPDVQAPLMEVMGRVYMNIGQYDDADRLLTQALAVRRSTFGAGHLEVARSLQALADLRADQGSYDAADSLLREALAVRRARLGNVDRDVAETLSSLSLNHSDRGDYAAAESLQQVALSISRTLFDADHPLTATILHNLAGIRSRQGAYDEARLLFREALAMRRRLWGDLHPDLASNLNELAIVEWRAGRSAVAESLYLDALAMRKKLFGDVHPLIATDLNNLGATYHSQGLFSQAEQYYRQALDIRLALLGEHHPDVSSTLSNLSMALSDQGQYEEAEPLMRRAIAIRIEFQGDAHPLVADELGNLAIILADKGDLSAAETAQRRGLAINREALGEAHPNVAYDLSILSTIIRDQGKYQEAESIQREALEKLTVLLGADHPRTAFSRGNLGRILRLRGRCEEATVAFEAALAVLAEAIADEHPLKAKYRNELGLCLGQLQRYEEGEEPLLAGYRVLMEQGRPTEKSDALDNVIAFYQAWQKPDRIAHYQALRAPLTP